MPKNQTSFSSEYRPRQGRGKSFKTKMLDAVRREALLGVDDTDMDLQEVESRFISHLTKRALDVDDKDSSFLLKEIIGRCFSPLKATLPTVEFEFDANASPSEQVTQLMDAASKGEISPDIAISFVHAVKAAVEIEEFTDLKERIEKLEQLVSA